MSDEPTVTDFSKLPYWVQQEIAALNVSDPEIWIKRPIPALGDRSVLETIATAEGEGLLRDYFTRVMGRF